MGRRRITPGDGDPAHGTANGYGNLGCRGPDCTAAWTEFTRTRRQVDPRRTKLERLAKRPPEAHPEPDPDEEPYVFQRPPVKRIETTAEVRLTRAEEKLLPWLTERLVVLDYNPEVVAFYDGETLVVRACLALMPVEAEEPGWATQVLSEAVEWARGDPRLDSGDTVTA